MSSPFFEKSKEIANDFIQSIVFIDDKAFKVEERNPHEFNAQQITQTFAKSEKICAVYKPETSSDIDNIALVAKKADISVIDWQIIITEEEIVGKGEEDAEEDEPRGLYTRKIIKEILSDTLNGNENLKLVFVYTGEIDLYNITDTLFDDLTTLSIKGIQKGDCIIYSDKMKIHVISKPSVDNKEEELKFKHNPKLIDKIVTYENLPEFILTEFTKMTCGLLSNFALKSLTEIRKNSSKLLSLFSKDLDPAYLSHQSLLPNQDDANELLLEIMKDSLTGILKYRQLNTFLSASLIKLWLDENIKEIDKPILKQDGSNTAKKYKRDKSLLNNLLTKGVDIKTRFKDVLNPLNFNTKEIEGYQKENNITLYSDLTGEFHKALYKEFAILTHHKSLYRPITYIPVLSLGTVVLSSNGNYFVCIQQRCDSVRIFAPDERRFLFILLNKIGEDKQFDFVTPSGIKLQIENKTYSIRTIKFIGHEEGIIKAIEKDGKYYFEQKYQGDHDEKFEWLFDLKDLHAQRIIANYTAELNRVGLDDFEWIRRSKNV